MTAAALLATFPGPWLAYLGDGHHSKQWLFVNAAGNAQVVTMDDATADLYAIQYKARRVTLEGWWNATAPA